MGNVPVAVYGDSKDVYQKIRDDQFKKKLKRPYVKLYKVGDSVKAVFNQCMKEAHKQKIGFFIICNTSIKPNDDWIKKFIESKSVTPYSFVCDSEMLYFCVVNVRKVRRFGEYKHGGTMIDLYGWLKNKSISEGYVFKFMGEDELDYIEQIDIHDVVKKMKSSKKKVEEEEEGEKEIEKEDETEIGDSVDEQKYC